MSLTSPDLKPAQDYDISVTLSLPPSPPNTQRGNFMVTIHLLDQDVSPQHTLPIPSDHGGSPSDLLDRRRIVFSSRRPALVPYVDPIVSTASRILFLLYHLLRPASITRELTVPLAERVSFSRAITPPAAAYVEIEAGQDLQTYGASLDLTAQLRGLRWLMHHYRSPMYLICTFLFWGFEVVFMGLTWSVLFAGGGVDGPLGGQGGKRRVLTMKEQEEGEEEEEGEGQEDDSDVSDHPHNFPTYGRQPPLKHEPKLKNEEHERPLSEVPVAGAEADDEGDGLDDDDDGDPLLDSGIGTSYSEAAGGQIRRRASRQGR